MEDTFVADRLKEWGLEQLIEEFDRKYSFFINLINLP